MNLADLTPGTSIDVSVIEFGALVVFVGGGVWRMSSFLNKLTNRIERMGHDCLPREKFNSWKLDLERRNRKVVKHADGEGLYVPDLAPEPHDPADDTQDRGG